MAETCQEARGEMQGMEGPEARGDQVEMEGQVELEGNPGPDKKADKSWMTMENSEPNTTLCMVQEVLMDSLDRVVFPAAPGIGVTADLEAPMVEAP